MVQTQTDSTQSDHMKPRSTQPDSHYPLYHLIQKKMEQRKANTSENKEKECQSLEKRDKTKSKEIVKEDEKEIREVKTTGKLIKLFKTTWNERQKNRST